MTPLPRRVQPVEFPVGQLVGRPAPPTEEQVAEVEKVRRMQVRTNALAYAATVSEGCDTPAHLVIEQARKFAEYIETDPI